MYQNIFHHCLPLKKHHAPLYILGTKYIFNVISLQLTYNKEINSIRLYLQYRAVKPPFCCISDKDWTIPFTMLKKIQKICIILSVFCQRKGNGRGGGSYSRSFFFFLWLCRRQYNTLWVHEFPLGALQYRKNLFF